MKKIIRLCENPDCWNLVEKSEGQLERYKHTFCCKKCFGKWLSLEDHAPSRKPEIAARHSEIMKGKLVGDKNPSKRPEVRAKISAARKGHEVTPETREKLSIAAKKQFKDPKVRLQSSIRAKKYCEEHPDQTHINSPEVRKRTSERMKRNNPVYMPGVLEKISENKKQWHIDHKGYEDGPKNPNWNGGSSYYPYCPKFNEEFKNRVRAYFDYECVVCGKPEWMNKNHYHHHVHHVDYNKDACCDGQPVQFVTLCHSCHMKTNGSRSRWEKMFLKILYEVYNNRSYFTKEEWKNIISSTKDL